MMLGLGLGLSALGGCATADIPAIAAAGGTCVGCVAIPFMAIVVPNVTGPNQGVTGFGTRMSGSPYSADVVGAHVTKMLGVFTAAGLPTSKFHEALDRLNVIWHQTPWFAASDGMHVVGLTSGIGVPFLQRGKVEVAWMPGTTISHTSFAHELIHVYLEAEFGDGDANHELPPGPWDSRMVAVLEVMRSAP